MPSVLITGADFGVGPELVRQYAANGFKVFAAHAGRSSTNRTDDIITITELPYDPENPAAASQLSAEIGRAPLDILILQSAGGSGSDLHVADISRVDWIAALTAGAFAPSKLAIALRSNLERGGMKKLVAISSFTASIGGCRSENSYAFRASKAALNSLWRTFSVEWRSVGISCLAVACDRAGLSRSSSSIDSPAAEVASALRRLVEGATLGDSGSFFGADGARIPW